MVIADSLSLDKDSRTIVINNSNANCLRIKIGESIEFNIAKMIWKEKSLSICFKDNCELTIEMSCENDIFERFNLSWTSTIDKYYMKDIIHMNSSILWYGGAQFSKRMWPIDQNSYRFAPYLPWDTLKEDGPNHSGMERYWLSSNGFAIFVPSDIPLWTEHYDGKLSLQAQIRDSPYYTFFDSDLAPLLQYSIFSIANPIKKLKDFHMAVHKSLYEYPVIYPDENIIMKPIWTTWARYKTDINQRKLLEFANEIIENNFPVSQIELDDGWENKYGDFEFNKDKFPNIGEVCTILNKKGIRLTLWIHPFLNIDSNNAKNDSLKEFFVKGDNNEPGVIEWWNGTANVIDYTNPKAADWFIEQLSKIKKMGISGFKFDAGEISYLPRNFRLFSGASPSDYSKAYVKVAAKFGNAVEVRVVKNSQSFPFLIRTTDRLSTW